MPLHHSIETDENGSCINRTPHAPFDVSHKADCPISSIFHKDQINEIAVGREMTHDKSACETGALTKCGMK